MWIEFVCITLISSLYSIQDTGIAIKKKLRLKIHLYRVTHKWWEFRLVRNLFCPFSCMVGSLLAETRYSSLLYHLVLDQMTLFNSKTQSKASNSNIFGSSLQSHVLWVTLCLKWTARCDPQSKEWCPLKGQ